MSIRYALLVPALAITLSGCLVWHTDTEREHARVTHSTRACGSEVCAADQDCVTVAGTFRCE